VVYLAGVVAEDESSELGPATIEGSSSLDALGLIHAISDPTEAPPRLWLVGSGGAVTSDAASAARIHPRSAPLWGLGRVLMNENPGLLVTLIDLAIDPAGAAAAEGLEHELLAPDGENEIVCASPAAQHGAGVGAAGPRRGRAFPARLPGTRTAAQPGLVPDPCAHAQGP
jgi:hypothetical protein